MPKKTIPETPAERTSELSKLVEGRPGTIEGDIDQRMAALLKDHQEMGARPLQEPSNGDEVIGDAHETTYPLKERKGRK